MRGNVNRIAALSLVVQRPRDLTRAELKSLRLELDALGYSDANLRRAWSDAKNEDIAASIIGFVRQAALGDALTPFDLRVRVTMQRILAARPWTEVQKKWLKRIEEQLTHEIIVDHAQRRAAYRVGDIRGEMAKGLERDPQVESILAGKKAQLGIGGLELTGRLTRHLAMSIADLLP